jgi:hypothetical protein
MTEWVSENMIFSYVDIYKVVNIIKLKGDFIAPSN